MTPEYIYQLADIADPDKLWRLSGIDQQKLSLDKKHQLHSGIALRRHASHVKRLLDLLEQKRSLLITPLAESMSASRSTDTPEDHEQLRPRGRERTQ